MTTETKIEGTRIHVTEVSRAFECLHRDAMYRTGRWLRENRPETIRGRAVHKAREVALLRFLKDKQLPPVDDAAGIAAAEVDASLNEEGAVPVPQDQADAIIDEAARYAKADRLAVLPDLAPHVLAVEHTIEVPISGAGMDGTYVLSGRLDAVARSPIGGRLEIPDLKTSKVAPSQASVNCSDQHTGYSLLAHAEYGEWPEHSIHHLRVMARGPRETRPNQRVVDMGEDGKAVATTISTTRTQKDAGGFLRALRALIDAREQGIELPASAGFMSPCHRCIHRGNPDPQQRCEFRPATRENEGGEDAE